MKEIFNYKKNMVRDFFTSKKIVLVLMYLFIIYAGLGDEVKDLVVDFGYNISIYSFPHVLGTIFMRSLILIGSLLLFIRAPYLDGVGIVLLTKMDRRSWVLANVGQIGILSLIYTIFNHIAVSISLAGYQAFTRDWGKIIYTITRNDLLLSEYGFKIIYKGDIVKNFSPMSAMVSSSLMLFLQVFLIGLLVYFVSLLFKENWQGLLVAAAYILSEHYISLLGDERIQKFIPVSYLDLSYLAKESTHWMISVRGAYLVLCLIIIVLIVLCLARAKKADLDFNQDKEIL